MVNKGTKFEYAVRDYFVSKGFSVMRAAGSHGPADLVCWTKSQVYLIQCKNSSKKKSYVADAEKLRKFPAPKEWRKLMWVKTGREISVYEVLEEGLHALTWFDIRSFNKEVKNGH